MSEFLIAASAYYQNTHLKKQVDLASYIEIASAYYCNHSPFSIALLQNEEHVIQILKKFLQEINSVLKNM